MSITERSWMTTNLQRIDHLVSAIMANRDELIQVGEPDPSEVDRGLDLQRYVNHTGRIINMECDAYHVIVKSILFADCFDLVPIKEGEETCVVLG